MFAKIINDVVEKYPYSIGELRKDNPNVSFPRNPSPETLAAFNTFEVVRKPQPEVDHTQNVGEGVPQKINGVWTQVWNVSDVDEDTLAERTQGRARQVRDERNYKIAGSDWTQLDDSPITNAKKLEWATYRQALRDIPLQAGFPWNVTWPVQPE
jgi:hypothetical protein